MGIVDDYIIKVRKAFPVYGENEKRFVADFRASVEEYFVNVPNCPEEQLAEKFGSPKEIAILYYSNLNEDTYYLLVKKEHTIKVIFVSIIIALSVMCLIFAGFCYAAYQKSSNAIGTQVNDFIIEEQMDEEDNMYNINGSDDL